MPLQTLAQSPKKAVPAAKQPAAQASKLRISRLALGSAAMGAMQQVATSSRAPFGMPPGIAQDIGPCAEEFRVSGTVSP